MIKKPRCLYSLILITLLSGANSHTIFAENSIDLSYGLAVAGITILSNLVKDGILYLVDYHLNQEIYEGVYIETKVKQMEQRKQNLEMQQQALALMAGSMMYLSEEEQEQCSPLLKKVIQGHEQSIKKFEQYEKDHNQYIMNLK